MLCPLGVAGHVTQNGSANVESTSHNVQAPLFDCGWHTGVAVSVFHHPVVAFLVRSCIRLALFDSVHNAAAVRRRSRCLKPDVQSLQALVAACKKIDANLQWCHCEPCCNAPNHEEIHHRAALRVQRFRLLLQFYQVYFPAQHSSKLVCSYWPRAKLTGAELSNFYQTSDTRNMFRVIDSAEAYCADNRSPPRQIRLCLRQLCVGYAAPH